MRDITLGDTIYIRFTTRAFATGIPTVLAGTPVLSVYEENNLTQITSGVSVTADYDSVVGLNQATIVATSGNTYENGKSYDLVITTGTVGGVSVVGEVVGQFTIGSSAAAVDLANGTDGLGALKALIDTAQADLDLLTGSDGATLATAQGNYAPSKAGDAMALTAAATSAQLIDDIWDEVLTGATHNVTNSSGRRLRQIQEAGAYSGGFVYINTVTGTAGTTPFDNGLDTAQSDSLTDALVIAADAAVGITKFMVAPGSIITLPSDFNNKVLIGDNWTLVLNGKNIAGSAFIGAKSVTGIGLSTTTQPIFDHCWFGAATIPPSQLRNCGIGLDDGLLTGGSAGDYDFIDCYSLIAGAGTPDLTFSGLAATTNISNRGFKGGSVWTLDSFCTLSHEVLAGGETNITTAGADIEVRGIIRALTVTMNGTETVQFAGVTGPIILNGTTTATVNLYGVAGTVTDNTSAATVTNKTVSRDNVNIECDTAISDAALATAAALATVDTEVGLIKVVTDIQGKLVVSGTASGTPTTTTMVSDISIDVDDQFNGRILTFREDTTTTALRGQQKDITASTASSNTLTFTAFTTAPVSGDTFDIT